MSLLSANSVDETSTKAGENTTPRTTTLAVSVSTANTSSTLKTSTTAKAAKQNTTDIQIQTTISAQATTFKQNAGTNTTAREEAFTTQSSHRTTDANPNRGKSLSTTTYLL